MDAVYTEGDVISLHTDIFPGFVTPLPTGVPGHGVRKRVVVTERCLTIGWSVAGVVQRIDIPMTLEDTAEATLRGGRVGIYAVGRDEGCSSCGSGAIKSWKPWPGVVMRQETRDEMAAAKIRRDKNFGLPATRFTRSR